MIQVSEVFKKILPSNPFKPRSYGKLHQITERVYIFRNITNSSFVVGDKSILIVDSQVNEPLAQIFLDEIRTVTSKPIQYVVNTHYHWDHTNGNQLFKDLGATIISSKLTKDFMISRHDRQKAFLESRGFVLNNDPLLPEKTFEGELELNLDGIPIQLFFAGKAESDDATAIHIPSEGVIMAGDTIMTGSFPIFGQPVWDEGLDGQGRWIRTIENILERPHQHVIPGHGPLAKPADIKLFIDIQKYYEDEVGQLVQKGWNIDQILNDLEPRMPKWLTSIPEVWGTPRYAILRVFRSLTHKENDTEPGWQQFKPSRIPSKEISLDKVLNKSMQEIIQMSDEAKEGGDIALQLSLLEAVCSEHTSNPDIHAHYADALIQASKSQSSVLEKGDFFIKATTLWKKAFSLNPTHIPSLLGRGRYLTMMAYRGGDDPQEGMSLLHQVLEHSSDSNILAEAEFFLGMGHRRLSQETQAQSQFKKSLTLNPSFMPAHLALQP